MSKGHQANRRRAYGRRRHEVRERSVRRPDLAIDVLDEQWLVEGDRFRILGLDVSDGRVPVAAGD